MRLWPPALGAVLYGAPLLLAGEPTPDTWFAGASLITLAPGETGGSLQVEWQHPVGSGASINGGLLGFSLAGTRWAYVRAGGTVPAFGRSVLHAEADLGLGRSTRAFGYRHWKGALVWAATPRLALEVEDQYVDVDTTTGNVVRSGLSAAVSDGLTAHASFFFSTSGTVSSRYGLLRADFRRGDLGLLAGLMAGNVTAPLTGLIGGAPGSRSALQGFAGVTLPVRGSRATLTLDHLRLGDADRTSVTVVVRMGRP